MVERVSFDRVADVYDETRGLPPRVLAKAISVLSQNLAGKRVLEIGVGTGRYAVPLQKSGVRVIGVDIAPKMVARGL
ncbi:MAG TPA: methyltransferase domain-containing protein, partial [Thermoplasmata archaeon]|nr:methyltransferase domain-containing protein [Thermoplasmata archaeon]